MERAYAFLTIKSVDDEQRIITGVATTPTPDRMLDIVEPLGVQFKNPMPLLWQHRSSEPVGTVRFNKPTAEGITFEARMPKVPDAGRLKDRIDEAWQSVKLGLVRAVSIGFRAIEQSFMENSGIRYVKSEVLELSLVTIPAQADAKIETIKAIDQRVLKDMGYDDMMPYPASDEPQPAFMTRCVQHMLNCNGGEMTQAEAAAHCAVNWDNREPATAAASGTRTAGSRTAAPGVTGTTTKSLKGRSIMKTYAEQIAELEAKRAAKAARLDVIMAAANEKGLTLDAEQQEEFENIDAEIKAIDEHLVRLHRLDEMNKKAVVAIKPEVTRTVETASQARAGVVVQVRSPKLAEGMPFVRMVAALAACKGNRFEAAEFAKRWNDSSPEVEAVLRVPFDMLEKTAVAIGTTTGATNAEPLVQYTNMASEFINYLRPLTVIGRITGFRRVPFKVKVPRQTAGASVNWVGEAKVKPLSALAFDSLTLDHFKIAGIVPLSEELVRFSSPSAEMLVRDDLAAAVSQFMDTEFLDPTKALATGVSPASVTNGVTPTAATGTTAAAFRADVKTMMQTFLTAGLPVSSGVWIMKQGRALALSLMMNALGQPEFPNISMTGGTLLGFPVIVSENVQATGGSPADGDNIIFLLAGEILLADDGGVTIDVSREASLQMDSTPDSPAVAGTVLVSLWQHNMIAIKVERFINWQKRRATAVAYISYAKYSA